MPQATKVSLPRDYSFNREVGVDVLEAKDSEGNPYLLLNIICLGTSFQQCVPIRPGVGQPTTSDCLDVFLNRRVSWAGWPVGFKCDRGLFNRGRFEKTLTEHGVMIRQAGVGSSVPDRKGLKAWRYLQVHAQEDGKGKFSDRILRHQTCLA
jgi:hypothetical protein